MKKILILSLLLLPCFCIAQVDLPVDFEDPNLEYFTDFGGSASFITTDPVDGNNVVGVTAKTIGAEPWAGTTIGTAGLASPIPFTSIATTISIKVYSAYPGTPIHLKVEKIDDPAIFAETRMYTTKENEWETIVFDFTSPVFGTPPLNTSVDYTILSVFFNFGETGASAGEQLFYWDDVMMGGTSTTLFQIDLPVTFEDPEVSYALVDFENNESIIGEDPEDPSNTVAITTKTVNTSNFSGTTVGTRNGFINKIPFSETETTVNMRVYSPDINTPILLKAEVASNPTLYVETLQYTTKANEWETIEWNFLQNVPGTPAINFNRDYNLLAVFFDFGTEGAVVGNKTYYWDDVTFVSDPTGTIDINEIPLAIFPNPVEDELQIKVNGEISEYNVTNILGQQVLHRNGINLEKQLNVAGLSNGTYIITVQTKAGQGSQLFIKS